MAIVDDVDPALGKVANFVRSAAPRRWPAAGGFGRWGFGCGLGGGVGLGELG